MCRRIIVVALFIFVFLASGRVKDLNTRVDSKKDVYEFKAHTVGGIWTVESNFGGFGDPNFSSTGNHSVDYPGGFGYAYLWEGRLCIGIDIEGVAYISHCDYGNYEWEPDEGSWTYVGPGVSQWEVQSCQFM